MPIELGTLQLNRIHRVQTIEEASLVYHDILGLDGSSVQNLGRSAVRLQVEGIFYDEQAQEQLEELRSIYISREPVDFVAAITGVNNYVGKVTLDRFEVAEHAGEINQFSYSLILSEYSSPPPPSFSLSSAVEVLQKEALAKRGILSLVDALTADALPEISNPFVLLKSALDGVQEAVSECKAKTHDLKELLGINP